MHARFFSRAVRVLRAHAPRQAASSVCARGAQTLKMRGVEAHGSASYANVYDGAPPFYFAMSRSSALRRRYAHASAGEAGGGVVEE